MAFFNNFIKLTPASSGAQRISGTQGDFTTWAAWALPQAGWATLFTGTNRQIWQAPSGNRCPLLIDDNSAVSGDARLTVVRACESATGINTLVDPFPQVSQVADTSCNWLKSTVASTLARDWIAYVFDWGFYLAVNVDGLTDNYPLYAFTDTVERLAGDNWGSFLFTRNSTSATALIGLNGTTGSSIASPGLSNNSNTNIFQMRNPTGAIKSSRGNIHSLGAASNFNPGAGPGLPAVLSGPGSSIDMIQASVSDTASNTTILGTATCVNRSYIPNMRTPQHSSMTGVSITGDFEQASHDPAARFRCIKVGAVGVQGTMIVEETNTWTGTSTG